jgi:hypothetical protein
MYQNLKIILLFIFIFAISCQEKNTTRENESISVITTKDTSLYHTQVDSCQQYLQNGCVVLRTGNDVISSMFAQFNATDKTYSHCGIAFKENNAWYVYHSIGGEDNPNEKLRRDTYQQFVGHGHNLGFGICHLGLNENEQSSLQAVVHDFYQKHIPFDMQFNLQTNDRLYCAEMVYKAYQQALQNDTFFQTTSNGRFKFVSTDNIFVNNRSQMLCRIIY